MYDVTTINNFTSTGKTYIPVESQFIAHQKHFSFLHLYPIKKRDVFFCTLKWQQNYHVTEIYHNHYGTDMENMFQFKIRCENDLSIALFCLTMGAMEKITQNVMQIV